MHLQDVVTNMVDNIQQDENGIIHLDVILSGGAFNAIYLVGCLYFLREMQNKNKIAIHRISSCSASSFVALLYLAGHVELFQEKIYEIVIESFKTNKKFIFTELILENIFKMIETAFYEKGNVTESDIIRLVNYKLYITYFDVKRCKRIVKRKYKSVHDIFETIKKSCYIPFITMNDMLYKNRYMDGWQPYIFKTHDHTGNAENNIIKKQLFIDLLGKDKIKDSIVLKNNKNSTHKIINGILDTYYFFYNKGMCETAMCSFFNNQSMTSYIKYLSLYAFSYLLCIFIYLYAFFFKIPSYDFFNLDIFKRIIKFLKKLVYKCIDDFLFE
jgi:hypothetical protein